MKHGQAVILSVFLMASAVSGQQIFSDDFESGYAYAWSNSDTETPWWQRQFTEDCVAYAIRYLEEDLWGCCGLEADQTTPRAYWTRSCGTNSGHRCNLLNGDEYLWVIFFSDWEYAGLACWDEVVQ